MTHQCHARGCTTPCAPEKLFCLRHWTIVPASIQKDVWKHYRDGQCDDKQFSKEWRAAADAAIGFAAMKEGRPIRNVEALELMARGFKTKKIVEAVKHSPLPPTLEEALRIPPTQGFAKVTQPFLLKPGVPTLVAKLTQHIEAESQDWSDDAGGRPIEPDPFTSKDLAQAQALTNAVRAMGPLERKPWKPTSEFRKITLTDDEKAMLAVGPVHIVGRAVDPPKPAPSKFLPMVNGQRPPPPGRLTFADAMAAGAQCAICPLSKGKLAPLMVPSAVPASPRYIVVGEGPGRVEEANNRPFIGPTGGFLNTLLKDAGLDRGEAAILNGTLCRGETDKEKARAAECCAPRLLNELAALPPELPILTLGKLSLKPVLGTAKLFFARGFYWRAPTIDPSVVATAQRKAQKTPAVLTGKKAGPAKDAHPDLIRRALMLAGRALLAGRVVLPTIHPSFVMRADSWKPIISVDINRFGRVVRGELTEENLANHGKFSRIYKPATVAKHLARLGKDVSVDIETDGVHTVLLKILCVGISDGKKTVVIHPWKKEVHAKLLSQALSTRTAVFHNGINFDMLALRRDGVVIRDDGWEDTILAHHVIGSHFPQRLDHCVSVYLDSGLGNWKMTFGRKGAEEKGIAPKHMPAKMLCAYNAQDCILDIKLWHALQDDLEKDRAIYEHDKGLARIAGQMTTDGIGVDCERRDFLRRRMKKRQDALKGIMRKLVGDLAFQVTDADIRKALFGKFKAPILSPTPTGLPSTASGTLEVFRGNGTNAGRLCDLVLNWRAVRKSRTTYIDAEPLRPQMTALGPRTMVPWKVYGTPTGRWSSRLQSVPRPEKNLKGKLLLESRVREIYVARPGSVLVYFDISQAEARIAANISGDPNFIETCRGDVHTGNALAIFPEHAEVIRNDIKGRGKPFRDVAKNFMFGIVYGAAPDTIHKFLLGKGFKVTLREVTKLLELLHQKYRVYFRYCERNIEFCNKNGYIISPYLGRRRFVGFHAKPEEIKNHPMQSGVGDEMNMRILEMKPQMHPANLMVGHFHDAAAFECPLGEPADHMDALVKRTWDRPSTIPKSVICSQEVTFALPIDLKRATRLSDL